MIDNDDSPEMFNPIYGIIVRKGKGEEIPAGAKPISLAKIVHIQQARIDSWVPKEDVWAIRHHLKFSVVFNSLTSTVSLLYIRRFFQLHAQKVPTTFVPAVVVPTALCAVINELFIKNKILEGTSRCSLCLELRGSVAQIFCGSIFPLLMSYAICIPVAKMEKSYAIPKLNDFRKFIDMWKFSITRGRNVFISMGILNCLAGFFLVNRMINSFKIMEERDNYIYKQLLENNSN